jgi:hypothetical protein
MVIIYMHLYMAPNLCWNKKKWKLQQIFILNYHGPLRNHTPKLWNLVIKLYLLNWLHLKNQIEYLQTYQNMFQTCVFNQKVQRNHHYILETFSKWND